MWPEPAIAPIAATPQLYTIDDLERILREDFAARGISAAVEVNEWDPEIHRGEPRVLLGLGDETIGEPVAHLLGPGPLWPISGTTDVARSLLDDAQRYTVLVHDPGKGSGESVASGARRATDQLKRATFAAIRRHLAGPFRVPVTVRWPKPAKLKEGYPAFTYGSVCEFEVTIGSPILDDFLHTGTVASAQTSSSYLIDGISTPPETSTA